MKREYALEVGRVTRRPPYEFRLYVLFVVASVVTPFTVRLFVTPDTPSVVVPCAVRFCVVALPLTSTENFVPPTLSLLVLTFPKLPVAPTLRRVELREPKEPVAPVRPPDA